MAGIPGIAYPMPDPHVRSLPGTPFTMEHPHLTHQEIGEAIEQARFGLDRPDYFTGCPQYGMPVRSRSPYATDVMNQDENEFFAKDRIRRTNLAVSLANSYVSGDAKYANLHPYVRNNGLYPNDFSLPRTVEQVLGFDNSQLDRILQDYGLPSHSGPLTLSRESHHPPPSRFTKLCVLLEYIGALRLRDHEERFHSRGGVTGGHRGLSRRYQFYL